MFDALERDSECKNTPNSKQDFKIIYATMRNTAHAVIISEGLN